MRVQSLVGELRSHLLYSQKTKTLKKKKNTRSNIDKFNKEELKIVTSVEQKTVRRGGWHTAVFKTRLIKLIDSFMYNLGLK